MTSSYLKNESENERKLRQYILDTIESFRNNKQLSNVTNVSRRYNPRSEPDNSSSNEEEEEDSDDYSDIRVNTNHIDEDVSDEDVRDTERSDANFLEKEKAHSSKTSLAKKENARLKKAHLKERVRSKRVRSKRVRSERARLEEKAHLKEKFRLEKARLVSEDLSENGINFWKTNAFKKWLIEHNRLLKHYMSEGTLHNEVKIQDPNAMDYDIGIWKYLIDDNYMANLQLDYSKDNFTKLFRRYKKKSTNYKYHQSDERKLLFIHMYLREAFLARHELRNIDFRKKLCLLADERKLVDLTENKDKDKKRYIRTPDLYETFPRYSYNYYLPYSYSYLSYEDKCAIFDIPQNQQLLRKEYTIATGYDNILEEVMDMILLAQERNYSSPLTASGFASELLTLNYHQLEIILEQLQRIGYIRNYKRR